MDSDERTARPAPPPVERGRAFAFAGCFLLLFAFGLLFVSDRSFWLDEVRSAAKAVQPTFAAFRAKLLQMGGSDVQMPLYMGTLWAWARIAGTSERALRALNLAFFGLSLLAVATERSLPRTLRLRWGALLAVAPLVAFYLDEARPYLLLVLGGTLVAAGLANPPARGLPDARQVRRILAGCVLLAAASLTGAVFAAFPCLWLLLRAVRGREAGAALRRHPAAIPLAALSFAALLAYYLWTLAAGYRGTHAYRTNVQTIGFCVYEFLGAAGLGPGRDALRAAGGRALPCAAPAIVLSGAIWLGFAFAHRRTGPWRLRDLLLHPLFACAVAPVALLLAGGAAAHLRILGRHLIPALPAFALAIAWCSVRMSQRGAKRAGGIDRTAFAPMVLWLGSSLLLRFAPVHAKDDDRAAAAFARAAAEAGSRVWWGGDKWTFEYYPSPTGEAAGRLVPFPDDPDGAPLPDLAVVSHRAEPSRRRLGFLSDAGFQPDDDGPHVRGYVVLRP